jgi:hypothetical protein
LPVRQPQELNEISYSSAEEGEALDNATELGAALDLLGGGQYQAAMA